MKLIRTVSRADRRPIAGVAIFAWIALSPWISGFADAHPAVANHVALVFGFAPLALLIVNLRAAAIVTMLSGVWLMASPWLLGYAGDHLAWVNEVVTGGALVVLCGDAAGFRGVRRRRDPERAMIDNARVPAAAHRDGVILIVGATGYVGGRLLRRLEGDGGFRIRCLTRRPEALTGRVGVATEVVRGDVLEPASLTASMFGVDTAYYLVHSMAQPGAFADLDREAARNFAAAAKAAGVRRIVYLGGLGLGGGLSGHLASRHEVGSILRASGVPTIELRASIVIGPGSASYEMVRAVVEHMPLMLAPRCIDTPAQPIAAEDVVEYLVAALRHEATAIFEIGGDDRSSYGGIIREYARQRGLRRPLVPTGLLTPRVSRAGLSLLAPAHRHVARAMVDSLQNATVVTNDAARTTLGVAPLPLDRAIERALAEEDHEFARTRWSATLPHAHAHGWHSVRFGRRIVRSRVIHVPHPPEDAFATISRLGGRTGWYGTDAFWRIRGAIDALRGGVGTRRGRRHPVHLRVGDTIDSWRVEQHDTNSVLRLITEMKLPGRLWLQFEVDADGRGGARVRLTTTFDPAGWVGLGYWYALSAVHRLVFGQVLRGVGRAIPQRA